MEINDYKEETKFFPILKNYLLEKSLDIKSVDNYNRRGFVSNINKTIWFIGYCCQERGLTTKKEVGAYLQKVHFLSDVAVRRYINMIIVLEIFEWSSYTKTFKLPKHIYDEIANYTEEQKIQLLNPVPTEQTTQPTFVPQPMPQPQVVEHQQTEIKKSDVQDIQPLPDDEDENIKEENGELI